MFYQFKHILVRESVLNGDNAFAKNVKRSQNVICSNNALSWRTTREDDCYDDNNNKTILEKWDMVS